MKNNITTNDPRRAHDTAAAESSRLARLGELDDFKVADGDPDIRGWDVKSADGKKVGKVEELIVDPSMLRTRYIELKADKKAIGADDDRFLLIPIGAARLDDSRNDVLLDQPAADLGRAPAWDRRDLSRTHEHSLRGAYGAGRTGAKPRDDERDDFYRHAHFDDRPFFGRRREGRDDQNYLMRREEELKVGTRQKKAGEVHVSKSVETERVTEKVPVTREEVTVERRPVSDMRAASSGKATIGKDEIRVPVMAEEVVTEKRVVPKEEIVIRKQAAKETKTVEADVRKERVHVEGKGDVTHSENEARR